MNTIFFGSSRYVLPLIEVLHKNYHLKLVITTEKNPTDSVVYYCVRHTIPYVSISRLSHDTATFKQIAAIGAPFAVLAHNRLILQQEIINLFPKGILNIHPSLLPKYRGTTPGTTALLHGDTISGVSIILLDKEVDHGPLLVQETEKILSTDTSESLYVRLFTKGAKLLREVLPDYLEGKIKPTEQDHSKVTFTIRLTREVGFFKDTNPPPKQELERMVRAYHPWPGVWTICSESNSRLTNKIIKFLPETKIQIEGKKQVSIKDFLNGYPELDTWLKRITQ